MSARANRLLDSSANMDGAEIVALPDGCLEIERSDLFKSTPVEASEP